MNPVFFEKEEKICLVSLLRESFMISGSRQTLLNAVNIYTKSIFDAINDNDLSEVKFIKI